MEYQAVAFITPMREWDSIEKVTESRGPARENKEASLFRDIFSNTVEQVYATQQDVEQKQYLLATGQLDDAHTLPIAEAKAALSLDVLITLRNKAMESYNELIKMSV